MISSNTTDTDYCNDNAPPRTLFTCSHTPRRGAKVEEVDPSTPNTCNISFSSIESDNSSSLAQTLTKAYTKMNKDHEHDHDQHDYPSITTQARNQIFKLSSAMGNLCHKIQTFAPPFDPELIPPFHESSLKEHESFWVQESEERNEVYHAIRYLFCELSTLSDICSINLSIAIVKKMELNARKYPVDKCKVRL
jgi:hypothetical protein